jgi:hypothetical protein
VKIIVVKEVEVSSSESDDDHPSDRELPTFQREKARYARKALRKALVARSKITAIDPDDDEFDEQQDVSFTVAGSEQRVLNEDMSSLSDTASFSTARPGRHNL